MSFMLKKNRNRVAVCLAFLIALLHGIGLSPACAQSSTPDPLHSSDLLPPIIKPDPYGDRNLPFKVPDNLEELPTHALFITTKGPFEVKLFRKYAPMSVANLKYLAEKGFYEGVGFHRYVPNFVIQGGDPTNTGKGGPGYTLPAEIDKDVHHVLGTVGWARLPAKSNPGRRSSGSTFYVCLSRQPGLDGFYTAFGVVVRGMENVNRLRIGDKILKVRLPRTDLESTF